MNLAPLIILDACSSALNRRDSRSLFEERRYGLLDLPLSIHPRIVLPTILRPAPAGVKRL